MATWNFPPQDVIVQRLADHATVAPLVAGRAIVGTVASGVPLAFELTYPTVGSAEVRSMQAFYDQQHGTRDVFTFVDPIVHPYSAGADPALLTTHAVRFDSPFRLEWPGTGVYVVGPLRVITVR